jgi:hypothetical protein
MGVSMDDGTSADTQIQTGAADDALWSKTVRTYRPGDWAHYALAIPGLALGLLILWIAITRGTLFESWATPVAILALLAYAWFALTKKVNRRTVTLDAERLRAADGPLPSLARTIDVPVDQVRKVEVNQVTRLTMPPVSRVKTYDVDASGVPGHIFKRLPTREEADALKAGLGNTLVRIRQR